jgi:pyruvate dehydrogenase complex dehydrogenase (E1) component
MPNIVVTVLHELAGESTIESSTVAAAIEHYGLDPTSTPPWQR